MNEEFLLIVESLEKYKDLLESKNNEICDGMTDGEKRAYQLGITNMYEMLRQMIEHDRNEGNYNVFVPEVKLIHYESKTRGYDDTYEKMYRTYTEVLYMRKKWGNILLNDCFYNPNFSLHFPFKLNEEMKKRKK